MLAEGVDPPKQLKFLQANGCDVYQGYLKSPPLPTRRPICPVIA
jgi:EAL domain-containing protein (putative c-di-GMP-specific phosphodiesterase class I)